MEPDTAPQDPADPARAAAPEPPDDGGLFAREEVGGRSGSASAASGGPPAPEPWDGPVARVVIDSPLPHLDRLFDYAVPPKLAGVVAAGSRVRVRLAGALTSGVVAEVRDGSDFAGTLAPVRSSSATPSFTPEALGLAARIARRYAGSTWDVLRLMAPPRVAAVEKQRWGPDDDHVASDDDAYRDALTAARRGDDGDTHAEARGVLVGEAERVVWEALPDAARPGTVPAAALVRAALERIAHGGSAVIVVPDARAIAAVLAQAQRWGLRRWTARTGGQVAVLDHDDGPTVRFGSYLAAMHGHARLVIGTRPSAMQPVPDLRLIAVWDEANGVYEDPHAPYPHARTVAAMRAEGGAALLIGGYALSVDAASLVASGWARWARSDRGAVRDAVPTIDIVTTERRDAEGGAGWHWMPGSVWRTVRESAQRGPVAILVPRAGYVRGAACARCDAWALCVECESMLEVPARGVPPRCIDQGHPQPDWHCPECHGSALKHVRQGASLVAEQLARMLGEIPLTVSTAAAGVSPDFEVAGGVVLATPGALPAVRGGYLHMVITSAGVPAGTGLGGELQALRWWLSAAALCRSRREGGAVSVVGELPPSVARALSTWSPAAAAEVAFSERSSLGLPPHRRYVTVTGAPDVVARALAAAGVEDGNGGVTTVARPEGAGVLLPRSRAQDVVDALRATQQQLSRDRSELRIRVDGPLELPT